MKKEEKNIKTKNFDVSVDITVARKMLGVAGYDEKELLNASNDEIIDKVISLIDIYGVTFNSHVALKDNVDEIISNATHSCEDVNREVGLMNDIEKEMA